MECEINNQGFFIPKEILTNSIVAKIKKELTVSPEGQFTDYNLKTYKVYKLLKKDGISIGIIIPIFYALKNIKLPYKINFPEVKNEFTDNFDTNKITLREGTQEETFNRCIQEFDKPFGGGILQLATASGKTIIFLKIACYSKMKTLIIVNKIELLNQWKNEIKKFIPDARIGTIQGKTFDIEDKDIVVGMLQTITIKKEITHHNFFFNSLAVIDESHNISSEVFSQIIFKIRPKYLFGLTATLERKDKLEKMIYWYLGDILYSNISNEKKEQTEIHIYKYKGKSSVALTLKDNETPACSAMLSNIADDTERSNLIIDILKELSINPKRNVLVLSDRVSQLKFIHKELPNSALFIGTMKTDQLIKSKESQILLATYKIASEGFSHAKLNCLLFATSRSNINQAIGRIYRQKHEITPIIVDVYDDFSFFKSQYYKRRKMYKELISDCIFKNFNKGKKIVIDLPTKDPTIELKFEEDTDTEK
jgi:superfamily II DNA or RNA helicase